MKKLLGIIFIISAMIISSCEGPVGPPGIDGEDGGIMLGSVFEIQGDFTAGNDYRLIFDFPNDFEIYDTDVVLVYILWEVAGETDVWRLLPQTVALPEGIIQYNFDYTVLDVQVFMEGTIPPEDWLPAETDNQIFRIAVLPADFAANKSNDLSDFNSILNSPQLKLNTIKDLNFSDTVK